MSNLVLDASNASASNCRIFFFHAILFMGQTTRCFCNSFCVCVCALPLSLEHFVNAFLSASFHKFFKTYTNAFAYFIYDSICLHFSFMCCFKQLVWNQVKSGIECLSLVVLDKSDTWEKHKFYQIISFHYFCRRGFISKLNKNQM